MNQKKFKNASQTENRLLGWLVSYGLDKKGFSFELRAGRTFITSEDFPKGRTLQIAEETICTPHVALRAQPKQRVLVQDVFSEHGSFITQSGSDQENPVKGPTELCHGDWLRVGENTRFQVCLIDGQTK